MSQDCCPTCGQPTRSVFERRANEVAEKYSLSPRQRDVVLMVIQASGPCPTLQEMAGALDISKVSVHELVNECVRKGALTRDPHKARGLKVIE